MHDKILYVTVKSEKDSMGRQHFMLEWMDNNIGYFCNETGLRGQVFFMRLSEAIERFEKKGFDIMYK